MFHASLLYLVIFSPQWSDCPSAIPWRSVIQVPHANMGYLVIPITPIRSSNWELFHKELPAVRQGSTTHHTHVVSSLDGPPVVLTDPQALVPSVPGNRDSRIELTGRLLPCVPRWLAVKAKGVHRRGNRLPACRCMFVGEEVKVRGHDNSSRG